MLNNDNMADSMLHNANWISWESVHVVAGIEG